MGPACHENEGRKNNYSLHTARRILRACSRMMSGDKKRSSDSLKLVSVFLCNHCNLNNDIFWRFVLNIFEAIISIFNT